MTALPTPIQTASGLLLLAASVLFGVGPGQAYTVTEADVRARVVAHVQEKMQSLVSPEDAPYITVNVLRVPGGLFDFAEAKGVEAIQFRTESSLSEMYSDRTIVRVAMEDASGKSRTIGVPVKISVTKPVWVVKNAISANNQLRPVDFALQPRDVSQIYKYAIGTERPLMNYKARVNLRPGDVLDIRKIAIPPDVTYNDEVRILMSNGDGMTVTIPGVALSDGRIGDTVRVRQSLFKRKYYSAKVIDKNRVLVEI